MFSIEMLWHISLILSNLALACDCDTEYSYLIACCNDYDTTISCVVPSWSVPYECENITAPTYMPVELDSTTLLPTLMPSRSPTVMPSRPTTSNEECDTVEEWTQVRSDELCPGEDHHAYGVGLCDTYDNPDYQRRLEFALANQLYLSCSHACLYDYDSYNTTKPHAFRWVGDCYNVATAWYCIDDEVDAMESAHEKAATLCEHEEACVERVGWTKEVAESNCPDGDSGRDKGWGTAKVCPELVRLDDGFFTSADVLYEESFNRSLANHIFRSCSSKCVYDIENKGVVYQWKGDCWEMQTDWACITVHTSEHFWALNYMEESLCPIETQAPVPSPCVEVEQDWNEEIALAICGYDDMGSTNKGSTATVCSGYEEYQYRLNHSLANRAFLKCDAWCVYDIYKSGSEAFIWKDKDGYECWKPVTTGLCIEGNSKHREVITDYIENTLCELSEAPSLSPTGCMPYYTWNEDRAEELCPSTSDYLADKSHGVKVCNDADSVTRQANLTESLANNFYASCASWCVYDFGTVLNNILTNSNDYGGYIWTTNCWKWVTGWHCFTTSLGEFNEVSLRAEGLCVAQN